MTTEGNMSGYENTYPYWTARLATGVALALGDLRRKHHEHLARVQLEALLSAFLASTVAGAELKRSLREELKRR